MEEQHTFQELLEMTRTVIRAFDVAEPRPWPIEAAMIEITKQVGDLARHIMIAERYYLPDRARNPTYATGMNDITDELADILYCVIRVAEHYDIDLEQAHITARRKEMRYLGKDAEF